MDCKEIEKKIPLFIQDELEYKELEEFVKHIENCNSCKEELSIQFLVSEGMGRLEEGNAFDLKKELNNRMEIATSRIRVNNGMKYAGAVIEVLAVLVIIIMIVVVFL